MILFTLLWDLQPSVLFLLVMELSVLFLLLSNGSYVGARPALR